MHNRAPCVWGFKVFPEHTTNESLAWLWKHSAKAIILERQNVTAQVVSLQRALTTGCWKGAGEAPGRCPKVDPSLSNDLVSKHTILSQTWYTRQRSALRAHARDGHLLDLTTEGLLSMDHSRWRSMLG
eukprot:4810169-Prymnesium_polylepis.2